ncbi:hypothetical protein [Neolewinella agarilytica]|uniref:Uncharacterized protein n=1 Tax=Neolewinella agarilytica TaxID=478744 RepID=A0A1H9NHC6_9BACT|nr:hypothetical protein [Neolewinella agarilytica]SER35308.1 hypothetical protein SAMN05444359_1373 [Neolewinella agarilytica]
MSSKKHIIVASLLFAIGGIAFWCTFNSTARSHRTQIASLKLEITDLQRIISVISKNPEEFNQIRSQRDSLLGRDASRNEDDIRSSNYLEDLEEEYNANIQDKIALELAFLELQKRNDHLVEINAGWQIHEDTLRKRIELLTPYYHQYLQQLQANRRVNKTPLTR